ncbi:hypothetical protein LP420_15775 [Massilia sp. B-10]|nr:hypothetical protein LP420_15775 [Massilia sp. B-10]
MCARGWDVTLIERHPELSQRSFGQPGLGITMPMLSKDDNIMARLTRRFSVRARLLGPAGRHPGRALRRDSYRTRCAARAGPARDRRRACLSGPTLRAGWRLTKRARWLAAS